VSIQDKSLREKQNIFSFFLKIGLAQELLFTTLSVGKNKRGSGNDSASPGGGPTEEKEFAERLYCDFSKTRYACAIAVATHEVTPTHSE